MKKPKASKKIKGTQRRTLSKQLLAQLNIVLDELRVSHANSDKALHTLHVSSSNLIRLTQHMIYLITNYEKNTRPRK